MGTARALDVRGTTVAKELPRRPWRSSALARGVGLGGERQRERGRRGPLGCAVMEEQGVWHRARTRVGHGGALCGAWLTRRRFVEHVVRVAVLDLEAVIGMLACRTGLWPLNKNCSTSDDLQTLLRDHSHWGNTLAVNDTPRWQCQCINGI